MAGSVLSTAHWHAARNGGKCLSKADHKGGALSWMCEHGHTWDADLRLVQLGAWCPRCLRNADPRDKLAYLHAMARARGGLCLSTSYRHGREKLEWQCAQGHRWKAAPQHMRTLGSWCRQCAGTAWLSIEEMQRTAAKHGGKCLSKRYLGNHVKLRWQCEKGHKWRAAPAHIRSSGQWCPHRDCRYRRSAEKLRGDVNELHLMAKLRGGEYLSKDYVNRSTPVKWRCRKGHTWMAAAANVKFGGTWCPKCPREYGAKAKFKETLKSLGIL